MTVILTGLILDHSKKRHRIPYNMFLTIGFLIAGTKLLYTSSTLTIVNSPCTQRAVWVPNVALVQNWCLKCYCTTGTVSLCVAQFPVGSTCNTAVAGTVVTGPTTIPPVTLPTTIPPITVPTVPTVTTTVGTTTTATPPVTIPTVPTVTTTTTAATTTTMIAPITTPVAGK